MPREAARISYYLLPKANLLKYPVQKDPFGDLVCISVNIRLGSEESYASQGGVTLSVPAPSSYLANTPN